MGLIALIKRMRNLKQYRCEYRIKPTIRFYIDKRGYFMSFLPTVLWEPWINRYPNTDIIDIWWLNFHILIGTWEPKKEDRQNVRIKNYISIFDNLVVLCKRM